MIDDKLGGSEEEFALCVCFAIFGLSLSSRSCCAMDGVQGPFVGVKAHLRRVLIFL
jgi:hypothetical protein